MFTVLNLVYIVVVLMSVSLATEVSGYLFIFLGKNKTKQKHLLKENPFYQDNGPLSLVR